MNYVRNNRSHTKVFRLSECENQSLSRHHAQEHRERVYGRIGHGRGIVAGGIVGVGQGRGIGVGARVETHNGEEVDAVVSAGDKAHDNERHHRDDKAPYHPPHAGGVEHRRGEVLAGGYADRRQEESYAQLAQQQRGRRRRVGDEFEFVSETAQ